MSPTVSASHLTLSFHSCNAGTLQLFWAEQDWGQERACVTTGAGCCRVINQQTQCLDQGRPMPFRSR